MEKEISKMMQKRFVKSFLDVLILAWLKKEPKSAYDIVAFIHKKFQLLMSPGTVYATLYSLERDGLIQSNFDKRKRLYTLTARGEKTLQAFLNASEKFQMFVGNLFGNLTK